MDYLKRLRAFVIIILVVGLVQGAAAVWVTVVREQRTGPLAQVAVAVAVALVGMSALAARRRMMERPWRVERADEVVYAYAGRLVVQVVLALGSATVAYAGAIVTGGAWLVAIGLVLLVLPLRQAMPTSANLARLQAWLAAQGCVVDLEAALRGRSAGDGTV